MSDPAASSAAMAKRRPSMSLASWESRRRDRDAAVRPEPAKRVLVSLDDLARLLSEAQLDLAPGGAEVAYVRARGKADATAYVTRSPSRPTRLLAVLQRVLAQLDLAASLAQLAGADLRRELAALPLHRQARRREQARYLVARIIEHCADASRGDRLLALSLAGVVGLLALEEQDAMREAVLWSDEVPPLLPRPAIGLRSQLVRMIEVLLELPMRGTSTASRVAQFARRSLACEFVERITDDARAEELETATVAALRSALGSLLERGPAAPPPPECPIGPPAGTAPAIVLERLIGAAGAVVPTRELAKLLVARGLAATYKVSSAISGLARFGIQVENVRGRGYRLPPG